MQRFTSLYVQSVYVLLTGLQLIFIPNTMLGMFGIEPTTEVWIRILGLLVMSFAILYFGIIKANNHEVVRTTVYSRLFVAFGIIVLAMVFGPKTLVLFASVDILTAVWTWMELKKVK